MLQRIKKHYREGCHKGGNFIIIVIIIITQRLNILSSSPFCMFYQSTFDLKQGRALTNNIDMVLHLFFF